MFILGIFSSQMFPPVLILLPLYTWMLHLGFVDSYPGIVLSQDNATATMPFSRSGETIMSALAGGEEALSLDEGKWCGNR